MVIRKTTFHAMSLKKILKKKKKHYIVSPHNYH